MTDLKDVVRYLCFNYPYKDELSKARVVKMIYLADWRSAIRFGKQITGITWTFNHYGPYVDTPIALIRCDPDFEIEETTNRYGSRKELVKYLGGENWPTLTNVTIEVLNHVIKTTRPKTWSAFLDLVYATYPVATQPRYTDLDLVSLAAQYRDVRQDLNWGVPDEVLS